jgi:Ca-activated chloride channel family protein
MVSSFNSKKLQLQNYTLLVTMTYARSGSSSVYNTALGPHAYFPASSYWVQDTLKRNNLFVNGASSMCNSTVTTPLGIAMWKSMATALGWPSKAIGWADIVKLANSSGQGWGDVSGAPPEWGMFKFAHENPQISLTGALTLMAAATGYAPLQNGVLTADSFAFSGVSGGLREISGTVQHLGVENELLDLMVTRGVSFFNEGALA